MRKILSITAIFFGAILAFAQSPEKMSYQAVVRNTSGQLLQSQNVAVKASILQGSATGMVVYSERLTGTTNSNGLLTTEIGGGTVLSGTFSTIDWSSGNYYLKTETDPTGGTNYTITGTSQLLSVPYAMYAKSSGSGAGSSQWTENGINISNSNFGNVGIGTNAPGYKLTVRKDGTGIMQESLDGNVKMGFYTDNSSGAYVQTNTNNDLNFATNAVGAQMTLQKTTGNLGIGNTNPSEKLDINGKTKTTNLQVTNGAGTGKVLTSDANGNATWQNSSGGGFSLPYVGSNSAAGATFQITNNNGAGTAIQGYGTGTGIGIYGISDSSTAIFGGSTSGRAIEGSSGSGVAGYFSSISGLALKTGTGGTEINGALKIASGTPGTGKILTSDATGNATWQNPASTGWAANGANIYNSNTGNVGIGTNSPSYKLTVKTDNIGITQESLDGNVMAGIYTTGTSAYIQTHTNTDLNFTTNNGGAQMTLQKGTGNLGIGKINPAEKLDVNGKTKTVNLQVTNGAGAGKVLTSDANGNAAWETMKMPYSENIRFGYEFTTHNSFSNYERAKTMLYDTANLLGLADWNDTGNNNKVKITFPKAGLYHLDLSGNGNFSSNSVITALKFTMEIPVNLIGIQTVTQYYPFTLTHDMGENGSPTVNDASFDRSIDLYIDQPKTIYISLGTRYGHILRDTRLTILGHYISE